MDARDWKERIYSMVVGKETGVFLDKGHGESIQFFIKNGNEILLTKR